MLLERIHCGKNIRIKEIQERPQFHQIVLKRRSRQKQLISRVNFSGRLCNTDTISKEKLFNLTVTAIIEV